MGNMKLRMKLIWMTRKMYMIYKNYGKEKYEIDIIPILLSINLLLLNCQFV